MAVNSVPTMQDLLSAGVHFGHKVSRAHPKMGRFIYGARDGISIIDLAKSEEKLKEASKAAYDLGKAGKILLVVGTKKQAREIVKQLAEEANTPYLSERWIGGLLTNFEEIRKNIKKLVEQREKQQKGELSHYTKKEQLLITRKIDKFEKEAGGIAQMDKLPNAIFVADGVADKTAVKEAFKMEMTLLGVCDTNCDPTPFDFPVPANDDGIKAIKIICETILGAYRKGKEESGGTVGEKKQVTSEKGKGKREDKTKKTKKTEDASDVEVEESIDPETAALEEEIEKEILDESERKVE